MAKIILNIEVLWDVEFSNTIVSYNHLKRFLKELVVIFTGCYVGVLRREECLAPFNAVRLDYGFKMLKC